MIKKFTALFYKYHRLLGLLTGIPMILWTISGISHPLMVHFFANDIPKRFIVPETLPKESLPDSIGPILRQAGYDRVQNFRLVRLKEEVCLQVQGVEGEVRYFAVTTGKEIPEGEALHAEQLARAFLEDFDSPVKELERVETFAGDYAYVNRLLPVMRVRMDRPDRMDIYVETFGDRLGTFNDSSRRAYLWFFRHLHTWSFLGERDNPLRITVIVGFSLLTFVVALTGIHLFVFMKRRWGHQGSRKRQWILQAHRWLGILFSLFLLGFAFSALMIALPKYGKDQDNIRIATPPIPVHVLEVPLGEILSQITQPIHNLSAVEMHGKYFYQVGVVKEDRSREWLYVGTEDAQLVDSGDEQYSVWLAGKVSGLPPEQITGIEPIHRFGSEYPFILKRLPVYKISYPTGASAGINDWFIETSSGYLSGRSTTMSAFTGVSFVVLHKFHFLDFLGKETRDIILILVTLFLCLVSILGVLSYRYGRTKR